MLNVPRTWEILMQKISCTAIAFKHKLLDELLANRMLLFTGIDYAIG